MRCDIENPAFDSQTKDYMNTPSAKFGSKCEVSDKFIEKVAKMGGDGRSLCDYRNKRKQSLLRTKLKKQSQKTVKKS